jgi:hypothetical protein
LDQQLLAAQEHLAASTFNRRYAALCSFVRWCQQQGWLDDDPLDGLAPWPTTKETSATLIPSAIQRPAARHSRAVRRITGAVSLGRTTPGDDASLERCYSQLAQPSTYMGGASHGRGPAIC